MLNNKTICRNELVEVLLKIILFITLNTTPKISSAKMKKILLLIISLFLTTQAIQSQTVILDANGVTLKWTGEIIPTPVSYTHLRAHET